MALSDWKRLPICCIGKCVNHEKHGSHGSSFLWETFRVFCEHLS